MRRVLFGLFLVVFSVLLLVVYPLRLALVGHWWAFAPWLINVLVWCRLARDVRFQSYVLALVVQLMRLWVFRLRLPLALRWVELAQVWSLRLELRVRTELEASGAADHVD